MNGEEEGRKETEKKGRNAKRQALPPPALSLPPALIPLTSTFSSLLHFPKYRYREREERHVCGQEQEEREGGG